MVLFQICNVRVILDFSKERFAKAQMCLMTGEITTFEATIVSHIACIQATK